MKSFLTILLGMSLVILATSANAQTASTTDSTALKAYAGSYSFDSDSPVKKYVVTAEKGDLYGAADDYGKNKLVKQDKADTYKSTSSYGSVITFVRDAATKAVTGFTMAIQGSEMTAKKDKP
ncbi:DUF3471 domain-containing protein [Spirosoma sp. KNUC1025]|uniref:DUF3471 domain-containing protein n=1 Tax=Spirosoma sp. KNUC1025 TaxID=2894082 RepID=UPI00386E0521|nr:DUF3471 domain-containing protein [Spirosoma sp. KNUC1025]